MFTFLFQNMWLSTQIHAGGLCGSSPVRFFQKPSFYLSARLVFSKGCSPRGRQPFKNLQFFNISLFDFIFFGFFVLKCIWFSWPLFWAKWLSRLCVVQVSESWGEFLGVPFCTPPAHKTLLLLNVFKVFSSTPQFYLRSFMFLASSALLGSPGPPWDSLGGLGASICPFACAVYVSHWYSAALFCQVNNTDSFVFIEDVWSCM